MESKIRNLKSKIWGRGGGGRLVRHYFLASVILIGGGLITSGLLELYFRYQESWEHFGQIQKEVAKAAAFKIENFVEVFVKCSLETCIERDPKGLYAKAQRGEISHFTGISDPYEEPQNPEIIIETDQEQPDESLMKILKQLEKLGLLKQFTAA